MTCSGSGTQQGHVWALPQTDTHLGLYSPKVWDNVCFPVISFWLIIVCVCTHVCEWGSGHATEHLWETEGNSQELILLLYLPCGFWGLNSGHQAWQQAPLHNKPHTGFFWQHFYATSSQWTTFADMSTSHSSLHWAFLESQPFTQCLCVKCYEMDPEVHLKNFFYLCMSVLCLYMVLARRGHQISS